MTKILKLKQGTPGQESYKTKLDTLRANGEISAENDALIQKIAQNANTWAEERMKDASKRERKAYQDSLYESMYNIATGGQGYDPYGIGNDTVRQIVADTYAGKEYTTSNSNSSTPQLKRPQKVTFSRSSGNTGTSNMYWFEKPAASIVGDWAGLGTSDLKGTILSEGNKWLNSLQQLLNAKNQGMIVQNYKGNLGALSQANLDSLAQFLTSINSKDSASYEDIGNFARIMSVLTPGESEHFNAVFQPYLDAEPEADKNWRALKYKGYKETSDTHEYLTQNKYRVLQDSSGKKYIYDENYNLIENPINYIDRNTNYGIFSDGTNTFIGNIDDENLLNEYNPLYNTIQQYKKDLKTDEGADYEWNEYYDPETNELYSALYKQGILQNGTRFTDVSNLFDGTNQVIAINKDKSPIKRDKYGELDLSNATLYYWDGFELKSTTKKDIDQNYDRKGFGETEEFRPKDISADFNTFGEQYMDRSIINADKDIQGDSGWDRFFRGFVTGAAAGAGVGSIAGGIPGALIGAGVGSIGAGLTHAFDGDSIKDDPQKFADEFISAVKTVNDGGSKEHFDGDFNYQYDPSSEQLLDNFGWNDPNKALAITGFILNNKNIKLSKEDRMFLYKEWNKAYKKKNGVQSKKQGGILKGKQGLTVGAEERAENKPKKDDNIGKAQDTDYREHNRNLTDEGWSTEDTLRLGSLTADLGSAIAAFAPGGGTVASVVAGLGSTAMDLSADIVDESTSMWELGANLVTNLGFTAAGAIPGVKLGKVAKSMIKWAPRIITGLSAANVALNDDIHDSLVKLGDNSSEMTVQDWKNVLTAATTLLGTIKFGKSEWDNRTVKKVLGKGTFSKQGLTNNNLTEDQVKQLNKALRSGNEAEAKKLARDFNLNEEEFEKFLKETKENKRTWKSPIKKKDVYKEIKFDKQYDEDALMKLWKDSGGKYNNIKKWIEINDPSYNGKSGGWYDQKLRIRTEAEELQAKKLASMKRMQKRVKIQRGRNKAINDHIEKQRIQELENEWRLRSDEIRAQELKDHAKFEKIWMQQINAQNKPAAKHALGGIILPNWLN